MMPLPRRIMFTLTSLMIFIGIGLTGWHVVHWFSYVPPALLGLFGLSGLCPALVLKRLRHRPPGLR